MSDVVIRIENLSKRYRYGGVPAVSDSLRADIIEWVKGVVRLGRNGHRRFRDIHEQHLDRDPRYFWALKDINLEIKQGEVVGIIGRNGAGKSTLLKILSRITPPTTGRITYRGRIASLLEVGTGFHRELTGRENIYLNGSILGMTRREITRKLDEIVAFAEIEKFLDTPVKFYSSGMYVRLAFAVAAHLDPEILIVDEVLAVGDANFQKKCLGKMGEVSKGGRTILFVSHNMTAILNLTTTALLLDRGKLVVAGDRHEVVRTYFDRDGRAEGCAIINLTSHPGRPSTAQPFLTRAWISDPQGNPTNSIPTGSPASVHVWYKSNETVPQPVVGVIFETVDGMRITSINNRIASGAQVFNAAMEGEFVFQIPQLLLTPGEYYLTLKFAPTYEKDVDVIERAIKLHVLPSDFYGTGLIPSQTQGPCVLPGKWAYRPA